METKYYPPQFNNKEFNCPFCNVFSDQYWDRVRRINQFTNQQLETDYFISTCYHCNKSAVWLAHDGVLIYPRQSSIEMPTSDLPEECGNIYLEAREIFSSSPKSSAALLRLCLQKLMPHIGGEGEKLNDDIKKLVENGLSGLTQKALDICRVVGNHAVHPGLIDLDDNPQIAGQLFKLINYITEDRITRVNQIKTLYESLPETERDAIEKRDKSSGKLP